MTTRPMGLVLDMPFSDYLAVDAFSNSDMKHLAKSAWHWKHRIIPTKQTRPMLCGSLMHAAQLEPDALGARYVFVPEDAPRKPTDAQWNAAKSNESSTAAKEWWKDFLDTQADRELVTADEYAITQLQLRAIADCPELAAILSSGYSECSIFWVDESTGVYCKARPDHVHHVTPRVVQLLDLKSTMDESPSGFGRAAARLGYHRQRAHYVEGFQQATRMHVEAFVFGAVTSAPPVLAVPYILTDEIELQGREEWRALLDLYAQCERDDRWPSYGSGLQLLDFPAYAKNSGEVEVEFVE